MDKYVDQRNLLNNKAIQYLLNKYRDTIQQQENEFRRKLKGEQNSQ